MDIQIREINQADYHEMLLIRKNELGSNTTIEDFSSKMDMMNKDEAYKTFVAIYENEMIGFISTITILAFEWPLGYLRIDGFAVKSSYQSKGIGTRLLAYVEEYAKEKGISVSSLNCNLERKDSHAFYESKGYKKHAYFYVKRLEEVKA